MRPIRSLCCDVNRRSRVNRKRDTLRERPYPLHELLFLFFVVYFRRLFPSLFHPLSIIRQKHEKDRFDWRLHPYGIRP